MTNKKKKDNGVAMLVIAVALFLAAYLTFMMNMYFGRAVSLIELSQEETVTMVGDIIRDTPIQEIR